GDAEVLALLAAVELSPHRMRLVSYVQDNVQLPRLTLATVARVFAGTPGHPGARALAPGAALRRAELVEIAGDGPWATRMCAVLPRVVWALLGEDSADPGLPPGVRRRRGVGGGPPEMLLVTGADGDSRLRAVDRHWLGRSRIASPPPQSAAEWAALEREATLDDAVLVLELEEPPPRAACDRIDAAAHLTWVLSSARELALDALPARAWTEVRPDSGTADAEDWAAALGTDPDPAYRLTRSQLRLVATAAAGDPKELAPAVRRLAGGHLDGLAVRIRPERTWHDLVLPVDQTARLRELAARCRQRNTVYQRWGFSALPS